MNMTHTHEASLAPKLEDCISTIPDFPKKGILFRDLSPVLAKPEQFSRCVSEACGMWPSSTYDSIGAFDARGFVIGSAMALYAQKPLILIRKAGKLPGHTVRQEYALEYGTAAVEMSAQSIAPYSRVLLVDDVLATGGTMKAGCSLVEKLGGIVAGCHSVIELEALGGRKILDGYKVRSQVRY